MGFCFSYFAVFRAQRNLFIFCVEHVRWTACVQRKFEGVYLIKNHRNNLLFSYHKLGFRYFELNLFLDCFDLKDLNLNKRFKRLTKDLLLPCNLLDLTKCPRYVLFTLPDQTAAS